MKIFLNSNVYEPAEDTFQLLQAIDVDKDDFVLELGTGCGIIALECAYQAADVVCSDVNPYAVELATKNYLENKGLLKGRVEVRQGDLFDVAGEDEFFDVIIFNPPYLPTREDERVGGWFDCAVDGGKDGLKLTKRFLDNLSDFLKEDGCGYFMFSSFSDREKLIGCIERNGLDFEVLSSCFYEDERLNVYRVYF